MIYTFFQNRFIGIRLSLDPMFPKAPHRTDTTRGCWVFETYGEAEEAAKKDEENRAVAGGQIRFLSDGEKNSVYGLECSWRRNVAEVDHKLFGKCGELTLKGVIIIDIPKD